MLRQEELAFLKALSCAQPAPALLKELRKAVASARKKKRPTVPTGSRSTTIGGASTASHRSSTKVSGKRKANELASSGDISEPATRRPAPGDGSAPLPATSTSATGEQAAKGARQLGSSEGGVTCGSSSHACRPAQDKWAAQAHSQGIGSVRTRSLLRDSTRAHVH